MMWRRADQAEATATAKAKARRRRQRSSAGGAAGSGLALCCFALFPRLPVAEGGLLRHTIGSVVHSEPIAAVSQSNSAAGGVKSPDGHDRKVETAPQQQWTSSAAPLSPTGPVTVTSGPVPISLILTGISPARLPDDDEWGHINGAVVRILDEALAGEGVDTLSATPMGEYLVTVGDNYGESSEIRLDLTFSASYSPPPTVNYASKVIEALADEGRMVDLKDRLRGVGGTYFAGLVGTRVFQPDAEQGAPLAGQSRSFVPPPRVDDETSRTEASAKTETPPLPAGSAGGGTSIITNARPVEVAAPMDSANGGRPVDVATVDPSPREGDQLHVTESASEVSQALAVDEATGGVSLVQSHSSASDNASGITITGGVRPEDLVEGSERPGSGVGMPLPTRSRPMGEQDNRSRASSAPGSNTGFDSTVGGDSTGRDVVQTSKGLLLGPNYVESAETSDRAMAIRTTAGVVMIILIASVAAGNAAAVTKERMARRKCIRKKKRISRAREAYEAPWKRGPNSDGVGKRKGSGVMK